MTLLDLPPTDDPAIGGGGRSGPAFRTELRGCMPAPPPPITKMSARPEAVHVNVELDRNDTYL